jgi:hypothetical protein
MQGSSDRERLLAHAEVLALQAKLGISYKDAAHRLYMAELERLKVDQKMYRAFNTLQASTRQTLEMAYQSLKGVGQSEASTGMPEDTGTTDAGAGMLPETSTLMQ